MFTEIVLDTWPLQLLQEFIQLMQTASVVIFWWTLWFDMFSNLLWEIIEISFWNCIFFIGFSFSFSLSFSSRVQAHYMVLKLCRKGHILQYRITSKQAQLRNMWERIGDGASLALNWCRSLPVFVGQSALGQKARKYLTSIIFWSCHLSWNLRVFFMEFRNKGIVEM